MTERPELLKVKDLLIQKISRWVAFKEVTDEEAEELMEIIDEAFEDVVEK